MLIKANIRTEQVENSKKLSKITSFDCNAAYKTGKRQHFCHSTVNPNPKSQMIYFLISQ